MAVIPDADVDTEPFSDREMRLIQSFVWLEKFGKTPADLGVPWDRVDRWWRPAMMWIKSGYEAQKAFDMDSGVPEL